DPDFSLYLRRSFATSMGYSREMLARPVVGIAQSASGFNNCHRHFPELIDAVKRGVLAAGGLPIDFPTISLGEVFLNPTSMMFRNLMAIDVEEMIRAQPMDAVVLVGGCDKTVPAQLMGAASADVPAVQLLAGPMMPMAYRGERLGACTDCRRFWAKYRAGGDAIAAEPDHHRALRRERAARAAGDRRLDECHHPPHGRRRTRRRRGLAAPPQHAERRDAGARRPQADRSALHVGPERCRRP